MNQILIAAALIQGLFYLKKGCLGKALFWGPAAGLLALYVSLPLTEGTAAFCAVLGVPGALLLNVAQVLLL